MRPGLRPSRVIFFVIEVLLVLVGVFFVAASFLPFQSVKTRVDAFASDRTVDFFTEAYYRNLVWKERLAGVAFVVVGAVLFGARRAIEQRLSVLWGSFASCVRQLRAATAHALRTDSKTHLGALILLIGLSAAARVPFLSQPIRHDEAACYLNYYSRPLYIALSDRTAFENHFLHTFLVRIATGLFGDRLWAIRLPAFLAGVCMVPAVYLATRALYNKHAAIVAAALVASSSILIEYSTNARGHTMLVVIVLLLVALGTYVLRVREPAAWCVLGLLVALGFFTVLTMIYAFAALGVWLLLEALVGKPPVGRAYVVKSLIGSSIFAGVVAAVLFAPTTVVTGWGSVLESEYVAPMPWGALLRDLASSMKAAWLICNRDLPGAAVIVLLVGFGASLVLHGRIARHRVPLVIPIAVAFGLIVLVMRVVPRTRDWLFVLTLYLGSAAAGLIGIVGFAGGAVRKRLPLICSISAVVIAAGAGLNVVHSKSILDSTETGTLKCGEEIVLMLKDRLEPEDVIVSASPSGPVLQYYLVQHGVPVKHIIGDVSKANRLYVVVNKTKADQTLAYVLEKQGIAATDFEPGRLIKEYDTALIYELVRRPNHGSANRSEAIPDEVSPGTTGHHGAETE